MRGRTARRLPTVVPVRLVPLATAAVGLLWLLGSAAPVQAETTQTETAAGPAGQSVSVSTTTLDPAGGIIQVTGQGFDESKGVYVAVCVDNGPGQAPGPCLGGVDTTGTGGGSAWISSNPPAYGVGLATPYGPGGSFDVTLPAIPSDAVTDCLDPATAPSGCAVVTRADHTRSDDRSADVIIPITFTGAAPTPTVVDSPSPTDTPSAPVPTASATTSATSDGGPASSAVLWWSIAVVVLAGGATTVLARRRRPHTSIADPSRDEDRPGDGR